MLFSQAPSAAMLPQHHARGSDAGITPNSQTRDYTDVVVVRSPYGEIPWPRLSRLIGEETKAHDRCREQDIPRADGPVRQPARQRASQALEAARLFVSLERAYIELSPHLAHARVFL